MKNYYYKKYTIINGEVKEIYKSHNLPKKAVMATVDSYRDIHNSNENHSTQELQILAFRYHNKAKVIASTQGTKFIEKQKRLKK